MPDKLLAVRPGELPPATPASSAIAPKLLNNCPQIARKLLQSQICRPNLADFEVDRSQHLVKFGPNRSRSVEFGQILANFGKFGRDRRLADFGQMLAATCLPEHLLGNCWTSSGQQQSSPGSPGISFRDVCQATLRHPSGSVTIWSVCLGGCSFRNAKPDSTAMSSEGCRREPHDTHRGSGAPRQTCRSSRDAAPLPRQCLERCLPQVDLTFGVLLGQI